MLALCSAVGLSTCQAIGGKTANNHIILVAIVTLCPHFMQHALCIVDCADKSSPHAHVTHDYHMTDDCVDCADPVWYTSDAA